LLKGKRRQSDINGNAIGRLKEQNAISAGKLASIRDPSQVSGVQQRGGDLVLAAKRTQQRDVDVPSEPRFAPAQNGEASDETEFPGARIEQGLQITRRVE
jgi:hypothetical protein